VGAVGEPAGCVPLDLDQRHLAEGAVVATAAEVVEVARAMGPAAEVADPLALSPQVFPPQHCLGRAMTELATLAKLQSQR